KLLLADRKAPYLVELCRAYASLHDAERNVEVLSDAASVLENAGGRLTNVKDRQEVGVLQAGFLAKRIAVLAVGNDDKQRALAVADFRTLPLEKVAPEKLLEMCKALVPLAEEDLQRAGMNRFGDAGLGKLSAALKGLAALRGAVGAQGRQLHDRLDKVLRGKVSVLMNTAKSHLDRGEYAEFRSALKEALETAGDDDKAKCRQLKLLANPPDPEP